MKLFSRQALGKCLSDVAVGVGDASEVDAQQRGQRLERHRTPLNSIEFRNCVVVEMVLEVSERFDAVDTSASNSQRIPQKLGSILVS
jgi:hypothetical protein